MVISIGLAFHSVLHRDGRVATASIATVLLVSRLVGIVGGSVLAACRDGDAGGRSPQTRVEAIQAVGRRLSNEEHRFCLAANGQSPGSVDYDYWQIHVLRRDGVL
jgi:hypothetical protein